MKKNDFLSLAKRWGIETYKAGNRWFIRDFKGYSHCITLKDYTKPMLRSAFFHMTIEKQVAMGNMK